MFGFRSWEENRYEQARADNRQSLNVLLYRLKAKDTQIRSILFSIDRTLDKAIFAEVLANLRSNPQVKTISVSLLVLESSRTVWRSASEDNEEQKEMHCFSELLDTLQNTGVTSLQVGEFSAPLPQEALTLLGHFLKKNHSVTQLTLGKLPDEENPVFCEGIQKNNSLSALRFEEEYPWQDALFRLAAERNESLLDIEKKVYRGRKRRGFDYQKMFTEYTARNLSRQWAYKRFFFQAWVVRQGTNSSFLNRVAQFLPELSRANLNLVKQRGGLRMKDSPRPTRKNENALLSTGQKEETPLPRNDPTASVALSNALQQHIATLSQELARLQLTQEEIVSKSSSPRDLSCDISRMKRLAKIGHVDAQARLGRAYFYGENVPRNKQKAEKWLTRARQFSPESAPQLWAKGLCYEEGVGVAKQYSIAFNCYLQAAQQGYAPAQCDLALCYKQNEKQPDKAVYWMKKAAEQGYANAEECLGSLYQSGAGVPQDEKEAVYWFKKAAGQGFARGYQALGLAYFLGKGVSVNKTEAVRCMRKAAEMGCHFAQCDLAALYDHGEGTDQNKAEAVVWFRKAAEQGNTEAQNRLGRYYYEGEGVPRDPWEAVNWFRKAAEQGHDKASRNLNQCFLNLEGMVKEPKEVVRLCRESMEEERGLWFRGAPF